jgi:hypothetical protein
LTCFEPEFHELSTTRTTAAQTQLSVRGREFDQFGEVFGWVSATDWGRLVRSLDHQRERDRGEIGGRSVTRSGREVIALGWVGGLVGGWLVVRSVIKSALV